MLPVFAFGLFPVLLYVWVTWYAVDIGVFAIDFHNAFWTAGRDVLHGVSPYPDGADELLSGKAFVYPAPAALAVAPLSLLPHALADAVFTALVVGAGFLALRLLKVRDWRCYGALLLWAPVFSAVQTANLTLLLALGTAAAWRYRDRPFVAGAVVAVVVALKPILWPLLVWLLATRRHRAALVGAGGAVVVAIACWAVIRFDGMREYASMLADLARAEGPFSYTPAALLIDVGVSSNTARILTMLIALAVLAASVYVAVIWRRDAAALALAVAASLLFSPIVWLHYFALLLVPVAVVRPRLAPLWAAPILLWLVPGTGNGHPWQTLLTLVIAVGVLLSCAALGRRAALYRTA